MTRMDCSEVRDLLTAFCDDELPFDERRAVGDHLAHCTECAQALAQMATLSERVRAVGTHVMPDGLESRVTASLGRDGVRPVLSRQNVRTAASHLAAAALGALILYGATMQRDGSDRAVSDAMAAHARALISEQVVQVASSDSHTVRPWFAGRVPFSPPVKDLESSDFPLLGGRLDYLQGRPAAVTVYGRRKHVVNVFSQPAEASSIPARLDVSRNGYAIMSWRDGDFANLAISDLNAAELRALVGLLQANVR
jgi:anti-sigma factor RsiW